MKVVKKILKLIVSILFYLFAINFIISIPNLLNNLLDLFVVNHYIKETIKLMLIVLLLVIFSSDKVYMILHKCLRTQLEKTKNRIAKYLIMMLIALNDSITAMPKRTFLFIIYLVLTVAIKMGVAYEGTDYLFIGVFWLGVDRVIQNWSKEKEKLFSYGEKVYGDDSDITDGIIREDK